MGKNSLHAHLKVGTIWRRWIEGGGHLEELIRGKKQLKKWREEDKKKKE